MSVDLWMLFIGTVVLASASPGPVMLLALANGARYPRGLTLIGILGSTLGHVLLMVLSALGVGAILYASEPLFVFVKWLGAAYLLVLGLRLWFASPNDDQYGITRHDLSRTHEAGVAATRPSARAIFFQALLIAAVNPKGLLFFGAFFPLFIDPQASGLGQFVILALSFVAIDWLWQLAYAGSGRRILAWLKTPRRRRWFQRSQGTAFAVMGTFMATMKRS